MLTLNEIRNVNFRKANFGGYRAEDVEAFIDEVQLSYDTLLRENAELVKKLEVLAAKLEEYQGEEDSIRNALMNAQKVGDASLRDAKHKAEIILKDATIKAEKIVSNAQAEILNERDIIERMQRDISEFKTKLLRLYKEHLTLINNLPTEEIMRPDTKSAVESVQMLDRKAVAPNYDNQTQQLPNARMPQIASEDEPAFGDRPPMFERSTGNAEDRTAPAVVQPVMPAAEPQPQYQRPSAQRKGGFTVDIEDENKAPAAPPAAPGRRESRFPTSFEDDVQIQGNPAQFADVKVQGFDVPADDVEPMSTPASLFKRRGNR